MSPSPHEPSPSTASESLASDDNIITFNGAKIERQSQSSAEINSTDLTVTPKVIDNEEPKQPIFVNFICKLYKKWAYFLVAHDWKVILVCFIISALAQWKLFTTPQENDITGYAPYGARAREEYGRYQSFFAQDGLGIAVIVGAIAKDGGSMLREPYLKEMIDIMDYTASNFTIFDKHANSSKNFNEFCISFCEINEPVRGFYNGFKIQSDQVQNHLALSPMMNLTYPIAFMFGRQVSLQNNFFGIDLYKDSSSKVTNMKNVKLIAVQFRAEHQPGWSDKDAKKYEMDIVNYFENVYKSPHLDIYVFAKTYIEKEMEKSGIMIIPWFFLGFLIMCICALTTVIARAVYLHQYTWRKILLAIFACILPFLSCGTGLAIMFSFGFRFASILCVIPFLVLAIGIDSSYLMIHEWQIVIQKCRQNPHVPENINIGHRMAEVLSEVGPAVLISTMTNCLADGVGALISSPEIALLCIGNALSMAVAFCFQMSFYAGLMSIVGKHEIKYELKQQNRRALMDGNNSGKLEQSNVLSSLDPPLKPKYSIILKTYVKIIANRVIAGSVIAAYFIYIAFSIYGITGINVNLSNEKIFPSDSRLLKMTQLQGEFVIPYYTVATVFVNNPGNLSNPQRLQRMNNFIEDLEAIKGSLGPIGTKYFVRDFLEYEKIFDEENEGQNSTFKPEDLPSFLAWPEYSYWKGFVRLNNDSTEVEKFFFTTAFQGKELSEMTGRAKWLNLWRGVIDKYAEFNASVFHEDGIFIDLIENIPTDTWQAVVGAVICIGFICYIFLNNWFAVIIATLSVLSISTGILGTISWWHVDLDPISISAMIICIGSSCDLPAHTSFHYYLATVREGQKSDPKIKLASCLSTIGFPVLQAATSMILCILALCFVGLYMATVFVKAMILCVSLCILHALVIIPAFLVMYDYVRYGTGGQAKIVPK